MVGMLSAFLLGILLPSPSTLSPARLMEFKESHPVLYAFSARLSIDKVIRSPIFLILPLFLFLSILLCSIKRAVAFLNRKGSELTQVNLDWIEVAEEKKMDALRSFFLKDHWQTRDGRYFTKGRIGFWGSIIFHAGMLVVFAGIVVSSLTNFKASMILVEDSWTSLKEGEMVRFLRNPLLPLGLPEILFSLTKFTAVYDEKGAPSRFSAEILFEDEAGDIKPYNVEINRPFKYRGLQATLQRAGVTPRFVIKNNAGVKIFDGEVNIFAGDFFDMFNVYQEGLSVYVKFFPDMEIKNGKPILKSRELRNPGVLIEILTKENRRFSNPIFIGGEAQLGPYTIGVKGFRHWAEFELSRDYGLAPLMFGILCVILGLMIRFIDYDRWIFLKIEDGRIFLSGGARSFNEIFREEIENLSKKIKKL